MEKFYRHLVDERFAVAMSEAPNGAVVIAFAACCPKDEYSRKDARALLEFRLTAPFIKSNLLAGLEKYRFATFYYGNESKKDIFYPIVDILRDEGWQNRRSVTRARRKIETFLDKYEEENLGYEDMDDGRYEVVDDDFDVDEIKTGSEFFAGLLDEDSDEELECEPGEFVDDSQLLIEPIAQKQLSFRSPNAREW